MEKLVTYGKDRVWKKSNISATAFYNDTINRDNTYFQAIKIIISQGK